MYELLINPEAYDEIEKAYNYYYETASEIVAENFYMELQNSYATLKLNPYFQTRSGKYKGLPLKRFPFILFFEVIETEKKVKILAVFNTYQDYSKWPK